MQSTALMGMIAAALAATLACSGTSDTGSAGTGGSSAGGSVSGSGGSGGTSSGGTGGTVSTGTTSVIFTVAGTGSYCMTSNCDGPSIDLEDSLGNALALGTSCGAVDCATCEGTACANVFCEPVGIAVTGAKLDWNGMYYASATCGSGTACLAPTHAKAGKYTATFCATPGNLSGRDGGQRQCTPTGAAQCGRVDFDFPSSGDVTGTVGP